MADGCTKRVLGVTFTLHDWMRPLTAPRSWPGQVRRVCRRCGTSEYVDVEEW